MSKFALYRFIAPFRSRSQNRLREKRLHVGADAFARGLGVGDQHAEIVDYLWDILREEAFVTDFSPDPEDDLATVYAMGPEEVRDDVIEPLLTKLRLSLDEFDFTGFDFSSITTPKDVGRFVMKVANAQGGGQRRFIDMEG